MQARGTCRGFAPVEWPLVAGDKHSGLNAGHGSWLFGSVCPIWVIRPNELVWREGVHALGRSSMAVVFACFDVVPVVLIVS